MPPWLGQVPGVAPNNTFDRLTFAFNVGSAFIRQCIAVFADTRHRVLVKVTKSTQVLQDFYGNCPTTLHKVNTLKRKTYDSVQN